MREMDGNTKQLFEMAKRKCSITWQDEETDEKILEIVEESMIAIRDKIGIPTCQIPSIFLKPSRERGLWKNYCLYMWNNVEDEFDRRYLNEIMQARRKYEAETHEKDK